MPRKGSPLGVPQFCVIPPDQSNTNLSLTGYQSTNSLHYNTCTLTRRRDFVFVRVGTKLATPYRLLPPYLEQDTAILGPIAIILFDALLEGRQAKNSRGSSVIIVPSGGSLMDPFCCFCFITFRLVVMSAGGHGCDGYGGPQAGGRAPTAFAEEVPWEPKGKEAGRHAVRSRGGLFNGREDL